MEENIINLLCDELSVTPKQVQATLDMLQEGNTVPFIARYRKEATSGLDENQIRDIDKQYQYLVSLEKRKEDVIRLIDEKGMLTDLLKQQISKASKLTEIEEIYRPFKEKRKTKATEAKARGLEPLAKKILLLPKENIDNYAREFINEEVPTIEEAYKGARDIIAEIVSDDIRYRKFVSDMMYKTGVIATKEKKKHSDEKKVYEMYYAHSERINKIASHRILAINRAESEKVISVSIEIDDAYFIEYIFNGITKKRQSSVNEHIKSAIIDGYARLLVPSIERQVRVELTQTAHNQALNVFSANLEKLLLQAPIKDKVVLGLDPAYRTGCKLAVVDGTGKVLHIDKVFITIPKNNYDKEKALLVSLIKKYNVSIIAIGNGTASRESEAFISSLIKEKQLQVDYAIISEAGASVYSASKVAIEEFPELQVEERSAVSIARRLQDPLAELVKIEPKAISVGQYQHDIAKKQLEEQLDFVVEKTVNNVGVDINSASSSLLQYVAGLNATVAKNIVLHRDEFGRFDDRKDIKKVKKLGAKTYQQAIGFLRIDKPKNPFDATPIHPDNYKQASALLKELECKESQLGTNEIVDKIKALNIEEVTNKLQIDSYTLEDILDSFTKPNRSPRDNFATPVLKKDILQLEDVKPGMQFEGTVRNVVDFGAFVDIGLKNDGLVHISKMSKKRINHPLEKVNIGDIVTVYVMDVDFKKQRLSLSFFEN